MRKSLILVVILLLFGGALGVYSLNSLLIRNKAYILQQLEHNIGRKISAQGVQVTFIPAVGLHLKDFAMADDPAYLSGPFISAENLTVRFKFLPLLLRQLRIRQIILDALVINIVRNNVGNYNFSSLGLENTSDRGLGRSEDSSAPATHHAPPLTTISLIQVSNGTIRYRDQKNGGDLTVSQIDLRIADLDHNDFFNLELAMAVFAAKQNFWIKTAISPLNRRSVRDVKFEGELRFDDLDMGKVRAALPMIRKELPKALDLGGVYTSKDLKFKGTLNKPWLKGAVEGTDTSFRFE